jgi:CRP/FNR family cyclic AMP-dependent transcriptional regulator
MTFPAGSTIFKEGDPGDCLYVVQSGVVEMLIPDHVVDVCGPNEALGFISIIDGAARTSTARVKATTEVSVIDQRKFRFMVGEAPNFATYIMESMAHRIRGMGAAIAH